MRSFARALGATLIGVRAGLVEVQASMPFGDDSEPSFRIVGLPDNALREGRDRIQSAVAHAGWHWPGCRVTVNLAPATSRKTGAGLDLPIAIAVLVAAGILETERPLAGRLVMGELGLDGSIGPVRGVLAAVEAARRRGIPEAIVPLANAEEAAAVRGIAVVGVTALRETAGHLSGGRTVEGTRPAPWEPEGDDEDADLGVRGQPAARHAARIAAIGGHNLLLGGPPGSGKTLLARQIVRWLPPLTYEEALEVSRIQSAAGLLGGGLVRKRPFRAPHHTTSLAGLVGGGSVLRPGEVSLAHLGVLFLDEVAEFPRPILEALRQPIEDGSLVLARAAGRATFPTEVMLVGATNPCPCGWHGVGDRCTCKPHEVKRYQNRLSGPIRDRFDLEVVVPAVDARELLDSAPAASCADVAAETIEAKRARAMQVRRARRLRLKRSANARIPAALLPDAVEPTEGARRAVVTAARTLGLTGRGVHRVLRIARTVADMQGSQQVTEDHIAAATAHRMP